MKNLALLPPLAALCSDLLFHQLPPPPPPSIATFPTSHPTFVSTQPADRETIQARPSRRPYQLIYHPPARACVRGSGRDNEPPILEPCDQPGYLWYYSPQKFLTVQGTYFCLKAVGPGQAPKLSIRCDVEDSQWTQEDDGAGKTRLVTTVAPDGSSPPLCLEATADGGLVMNACVLGNDKQWFEIITADSSGQASAAAAAEAVVP